MSVPNRQIGWSQESNLLWQILKQLNKLTSVMFGLKPKYKVFSALVYQDFFGGNPLSINSGSTTIGISYTINSPGILTDFTNIGAPNNLNGTSFIATGTTPNNWDEATLLYNESSPVIQTVLENTLGNVWFTYLSDGSYVLNSDNLFTLNKTTVNTSVFYNGNEDAMISVFGSDLTSSTIIINNIKGSNQYLCCVMYNTLIEVKVYN